MVFLGTIVFMRGALAAVLGFVVAACGAQDVPSTMCHGPSHSVWFTLGRPEP